MTAHLEIITASAPHIYHSALVYTPETSVVRKLYESYVQPFTRVVHGLPVSWDSHTAAAVFSDLVEEAVWSSCSRFIAIAFENSTLVDILDSVALQKLQTLKFERVFEYGRSGFGFSPDGRMFTRSGHNRGESKESSFVVTWDLQTGSVISAIERPLNKPEGIRITYSKDGKVIGVLHQCHTATTISIYNVLSGEHTHDVYHRSHQSIDDQPLDPRRPWRIIWTHGESLRFATATLTSDRLTTVAIWEVGFIPGSTSTKVRSLFIPTRIQPPGQHQLIHCTRVQFHPTLHRLVLFGSQNGGGVLVWDYKTSRCLLHSTDISFYSDVTFSSDSRFFACSNAESNVFLWKESSTGYVLHGILTPSTQHSIPLLSPNGELLFTHGGSVTRLWRTKSFTSTPSTAPIQTQRIENFILEFIPDRSLAVVARQKDNTVTVLDLNSGVPQWTIDTGMDVYGLRVIGETIAVIGGTKVTGWNLPGDIASPGARMGIEDSIRAIRFWWGSESPLVAGSVSFDFGHIAVILGSGEFGRLEVYTATGQRLRDSSPAMFNSLWFLPDRPGIGLVVDGNRGQVQLITTEGALEGRTPIGDIENGQWGCPHGSSRGYKVTNDGWIISPSRKRLLMLPPQWRAQTGRRVWNGQFLGLLHGTLPEAVILELEPPPVAL